MKHNYEQLLHYMHLLEKGYSAWNIHSRYGINNELLKRYWKSYQRYRPSALHKKRKEPGTIPSSIPIEGFLNNVKPSNLWGSHHSATVRTVSFTLVTRMFLVWLLLNCSSKVSRFFVLSNVIVYLMRRIALSFAVERSVV